MYILRDVLSGTEVSASSFFQAIKNRNIDEGFHMSLEYDTV